MADAGWLGIALPDHHAFFYHYRSYCRVGAYLAQGQPGQRQCLLHVVHGMILALTFSKVQISRLVGG